MWEYRLIWSGGPPSWWDRAWRRGLDAVAAQGREAEERPDTYLVLLDRDDVGLKKRGSEEESFDLKVRHRQSGGWELWEKCAFFRWDGLEVLRFAALLQLPPPADLRVRGAPTPGQGVDAFVTSAGLRARNLVVDKKRLQTAVRDLLPEWPGSPAGPGWIAELVEIGLPGRGRPLFSLCFEAMTPTIDDPMPASGGVARGYPELLRRHLRGSP